MQENQDIEKKWQDVWAKDNIAHTEPNNDQKKFYMVFAYPYPTGFLHTGHMRGFSYSDVIIRFHKLIGYNVFFPTGIHATGNGAIAKAQEIAKGDEKYISYLKQNGLTDKQINQMKDPDQFINLFAERYLQDYKSFGMLINDKPFLTTLNPIYKKFITWQFLKLEEKGLLSQGEYYATVCENCGPVAVDPSESDISKGGHAEKNEYTLLKFKTELNNKSVYLVTATLRPETVYGQTNLWITPDSDYVLFKVKDTDNKSIQSNKEKEEIWIANKEFVDKFKYQKDIEIIKTVNSNELIGKLVMAPGLNKNIPILPGEFIDPRIGTAIVTSVPSDAPHDYVALLEAKTNCEKWGICDIIKDIEPVAIIKTEGMADMPAVDICNKMGIKTSSDPRIEKAKKEVYKAGFYKGIMISGPFKGMKVEEAKDKIKDKLIGEGKADKYYELSEEVTCRCGGNVYIQKFDHQWFIDYSKEWLNKDAVKHAKSMKIKPDDYYEYFPEALEWFKERPCARMGRWMGTQLPQDKRYIIEAISDSTMYPLFFIISNFQKEFTHEQLTPKFFDYVCLGKGNEEQVAKENGMKKELIENIKQSVDYWYPLDLNLGGKEHKTVHFPPFLKSHVAILPKNKWPKGIFVHGWVTSKGGVKVSKSKGGAEPVPKMIKKYGADVMRLFYANIASPFSDMALDNEVIENYRNRIRQLESMIKKMVSNEKENVKDKYIDNWLTKRTEYHLSEYSKAMKDYDIKKASDHAFYLLPNDVEWYIKRGGSNHGLLHETAKVLVQIWTPMTPHICEEMWHETLKLKGLVSTSLLNIIELKTKQTTIESKSMISKPEYDPEEYVRNVVEDISKIIKVVKIEPKKISIYTCSNWKKKVVKDGMEIDMKTVIPTLMQKEYGVDKTIQAKFIKGLTKKIADYKSLPKKAFETEELNILENAKTFIEQRFNAKININKEEDANNEHKTKAAFSGPLKPGIIIE